MYIIMPDVSGPLLLQAEYCSHEIVSKVVPLKVEFEFHSVLREQKRLDNGCQNKCRQQNSTHELQCIG